jgi:hypothetical protein
MWENIIDQSNKWFQQATNGIYCLGQKTHHKTICGRKVNCMSMTCFPKFWYFQKSNVRRKPGSSLCLKTEMATEMGNGILYAQSNERTNLRDSKRP